MDPISCVRTLVSDIALLKADDKVIVLKCFLPRECTFEECPALAGRDIVILKWSSNPNEYTHHQKISDAVNQAGLNSFVTCFGGKVGNFKISDLLPEHLHKKLIAGIPRGIINKKSSEGSLSGSIRENGQSIIIMEAMDGDLEKVIPLLSQEQRKLWMGVVPEIIMRTLDVMTLQLGLGHGDIRLRNIYYRIPKSGGMRIKLADCGSVYSLNVKKTKCDNCSPITSSIGQEPRKRPRIVEMQNIIQSTSVLSPSKPSPHRQGIVQQNQEDKKIPAKRSRVKKSITYEQDIVEQQVQPKLRV